MRPILFPLCLLAILFRPSDAVFGSDEDTEPTTAERVKSQNNLRQIGLAYINYESTYKQFPTNIVDQDGKPLLSWRVAILPYLEEDALYRQFKLDEPWDSDHNLKLAEKMPPQFAPVRGKATKNSTYYLRASGEGTALNSNKRIRIVDIKDGTTQTLFAAESATPVIWTKPEDLLLDEKKELPKFGGMFKGDFNALFCDGSVRYMKKDTDPKTLKAMMTIRGKEVIDLDK